MTNKERRHALELRAIAAEQEIDEYLRTANAGTLRLFRTTRLQVRDVGAFWVRTKLSRPETSEAMWLRAAEEHLDRVMDVFRGLKDQMDQFGGPSRIQTIGS